MDAEDITFPATEDWNSQVICSLSAFRGSGNVGSLGDESESEDGKTSGKLYEHCKKSGKLFLTLIDKA